MENSTTINDFIRDVLKNPKKYFSIINKSRSIEKEVQTTQAKNLIIKPMLALDIEPELNHLRKEIIILNPNIRFEKPVDVYDQFVQPLNRALVLAGNFKS